MTGVEILLMALPLGLLMAFLIGALIWWILDVGGKR